MTALLAAEAISPAVNEMLWGCRTLGLDYQANPDSPDGPWRTQCPVCRTMSGVDERPLTITAAGHIRCSHRCDPEQIAAELEQATGASTNGGPPSASSADAGEARIVSLEEFVAVDEPGAEPLLGDEGGALIPEGGDVLVYGDGGAGKTTLLFDLALHLAAGEDWLEVPVKCPVNLLVIENEGPRPLLRNKLKRKIGAWKGAAPNGRISVFEHPWGQVTLAESAWRERLAASVRELEVDVIIAGPLTRLGMDTAGTLQEVVAFTKLVDDVRKRSGRLLTAIVVHHENKAGSVSGAWEGAVDTLLHVQAAGNGHTVVFIQKARWASDYHHKTLKLAWTDGEGFELEGDRDYVAETRELLADRPWLTAKQIAKQIGAGEAAVKEVLNGNSELFEVRSGDDAKALGRSPRATVYGLHSGASAVDAVGEFQGGAEGTSASASPVRDADVYEHTPNVPLVTESTLQLSAADWPQPEEEIQRLIDSDPGQPDDWHRNEDEHLAMANEDLEF